MKHGIRYLLAAAVLLTSACSEDQLAPDRATSPTIVPSRPSGPSSLVSPPLVCPSVGDAQTTVDTLLPQLFGPGGGRRGKAQGYSNNIEQQRRNGSTALEQTYVDSLVNFTLQTYYDGHLIGGQSTATQDRVLSFFYALYCASGISPIPDLSGIFSAENTVFIRNSTPTTVVSADSAAVQVEQGEVPSNIFGTFVSVYETTNPLPTSLDWYGLRGYKLGAFEFVSNPEVTFTAPVLTGVCIQYDDAIVSSSDLRLAHQVEPGYTPVVSGNSVLTTAGGTIEIGEYADPGPLGLACNALPPPPIATRGLMGLLRQFAQLILPGQLYAGTSGGSTGTQVVKFSPFAAVDTKLQLSSTGPSGPQYIPLGSTTTSSTVAVTVTTRYNLNSVIPTPIDGIPVSFAPGGSFSATPVSTDNNGTASSTWTLVAGTNTAAGTPSQAPLSFEPSAASFSATAVQLTTLSVTTTSPLPSGQQTVAYGKKLDATGGAGPGSYSWELAPGSNPLPGGLAIADTGAVVGTPTVPGSFTFDVRVTSGPLFVDKTFAIDIAVPPVTISTTALTPATAGASYSQFLQAIGGAGVGSYVWSGTFSPAPFTISAAGEITNTAVLVAGSSYSLPVQVTSGTGLTAVSATKTFTLSVISPTAVKLSFKVGPAKNTCYAVDKPMNPGIQVEVRDSVSNSLLSSVIVNLVGVTNNGSKVTVSPSSVSSSGGIASFGGPTFNKTGGYALIASTTTPGSPKSVTSGKFTISPSCP